MDKNYCIVCLKIIKGEFRQDRADTCSGQCDGIVNRLIKYNREKGHTAFNKYKPTKGWANIFEKIKLLRMGVPANMQAEKLHGMTIR